SQTVVVRDLTLLYEERLGGGDAGLPDPVLQPGDVAAWQRARLAAGELEAPLERWRRRLAGLEPLRLPIDRPRSAVPSNRGGSVPWVLAPDLVGRLRGVGRTYGATLFTTLLAGFQALLGRLAGTDDVAVGTPVANRDAPGLADTVAFLVDTVVLRADLGGEPSFAQALTRLRGSVLDAFRDHDVPFERVVEAVRPERDLGRTPLFEVLFAFQDLPEPGRRLGEASLALEAVGTGTTQFDLTLSARPEAEAVVGSVEYRRDLFDEVSVRRLARQLEILLAAAAESPARPLVDLPLQSRAQRHQVLLELGGAKADLRGAEPLYARFRRHAERSPDIVALVADGMSLSYGELRRWAERCAARLRASGIGPEDVVGVLSERVDLFVAGALGVHAAGAAYLPLDPEHPSERLRTVLADARARAVLAHGPGVQMSPASAPSVLSLADAVAGSGGIDRPLPGLHAAYVIYTSGSTGSPKGVVVSQAGLARLFDASREGLSFFPEDTVAQFNSPAFDFSLWEMWSALSHGARLAVVPREARYAADELARFLERQRVTVLGQTPSAFSRLLEVETLRDRPLAPDLRLLDLGGEALSPPVLAPWFARRPGRRPRMVNVYGPTEVVVLATCREISVRDVGVPGASVLGHQIADATLRLVNRAGSVVPLGAAGEIWVGGAAVARGYLGRPDLTAERFIPDPWGERPGARVYRTGDLARRDHSGELQFLGRVDDQVKIRGHRIEPAEVEAAVLELPGAEQAAVVARPGGVDGALQLVAYVVGIEDTVDGVSVPALRDLLAERLPGYMVPERWVVLERLPLTPSGKLDRRALPDPPPLRRGAEGRLVEPRSDLEERIAEIWRSVLGVDRVGVHDNFFDLGGHSLLLARAHRELCRVLDREIPLVQLFRHPSIAGLAASLGADPADDAHSGARVQGAVRTRRAARRHDRLERLRAARRGPGRSRPAGGGEDR
ncbi:MAG: non-ribosomal peptide synthetase, partial [Thermoanaerobaculia bacterium]